MGFSASWCSGRHKNFFFFLPQVYEEVAKTMARMHTIPLKEKEPCIWNWMAQYIDLLPEKFEDEKQQERIDKVMEKEYSRLKHPSLDCRTSIEQQEIWNIFLLKQQHMTG